MYTYSYPHNSLIAGAIEESGTAFAGVFINQTNIANTWFATAQAVGCGNSSSPVEAVMACMKKTKWQDLLSASPKGNPTLSFWPTIDDK
jgi:cholinesterase